MGRVLSVFFVFIFLFYFAKETFAANFSTDYKVTYSISESSKTRVSFDITLTNTTSEYYASSYSIRVGFKDIENVKASDPEGSINPKITKDANGGNIELTFNKRVTGLNNKLNFNLSFDTNEVASKNGNIWEVNIPGLSNQNEFASFNVVLTYPNFLGKPAYIKPDISNVRVRSNGNSLSFSKSDLGAGGISIAFGDFQIYSYDLTYHLENKNLFPVTTEIALPPQTSYQDVSLDYIYPKPKNVYIDSDGNWMAKYSLSPSQDVDVRAKGHAKIYLNPRGESVSTGLMSRYTLPQKYWETQDSKIKSLAQDLKTPRGIYDYIVSTLNYDFSRVSEGKERLGALNVLNNPNSAVCLEFTDFFVGLARSAGIAAREVDGFAFTKNPSERPLSLVKDVLHAWPEYYDNELGTWKMIDPTWGNTTNGIDYFDTFDFDHFALVIKGEDSSYPIPAGGYKRQQDLSRKDVDVKVGDSFEAAPVLQMSVSIPKESLPWVPVDGIVTITNAGSGISEYGNLEIDTNFLSPERNSIVVERIPPLGSVEIPIKFATSSFLTKRSDTITIRNGKNEFQQSIVISPFTSKSLLLGGVFIVATFTLSIAIVRSRRILLRRQQG